MGTVRDRGTEGEALRRADELVWSRDGLDSQPHEPVPERSRLGCSSG